MKINNTPTRTLRPGAGVRAIEIIDNNGAPAIAIAQLVKTLESLCHEPREHAEA